VLPNSPRAAIEIFLAGIPQRIGYARPWRNFFLTQTVAPRAEAVTNAQAFRNGNQKPDFPAPEARRQIPQFAHQIHEYLHLAAVLGANPGTAAAATGLSTPEEIESAKKKFGLEKIDAADFRPESRRGIWPGQTLADGKIHRRRQRNPAANELRLAFVRWQGDASNSQTQIESAIHDSAIHDSQSGRPDFASRADGAPENCRVLLTNDTGPMHVAAALGTPVVVPFGSTSPELTGPGLPGDPRNHLLKSDAPCSPCFLRECPIDFRCMNGIAVGARCRCGFARRSRLTIIPPAKIFLTPAANCHSVLCQ
jgi:heptosyltransferase-2